jgi:hypothetical protein
MTNLTALVQPTAYPVGNGGVTGRGRGGKGALVQPAEGGIGWGAAVVNLGACGLGLLLCFPFKPGTVLAVRLEKAGRYRTVMACVREAAERGDGSWLVGCDLTPALSDEELQNLL